MSPMPAMYPVQQQRTMPVPAPAPNGGILAKYAYYSPSRTTQNRGGTDTAIWLYNMVARDAGCTVRPGSEERATNLGGEVRTVMYYNSQVSQGSGGVDYLFAATDAGIFDVTVDGAGPWTPVLAWPTTGGNAGWCSFQNFTNDNGDHYLLVTDEVNGYYTFDGTTWAQGSFSGPGARPDPENVVHVQEWQNRVFFVERDTTTAWYTDPGAITGDVTKIDFGSRFRKGGHLVATGTWTVDDGEGLDDKFVAASSSGDVLVFSGFDPSSAANWLLQGRWFVGELPEGRRQLSRWGGDLAIISTRGLQRLSAMMKISSSTPLSLVEDELTSGIDRYYRLLMDDAAELYGWSIELYPEQDIAVVSTPTPAGRVDQRPLQFVYNTSTHAWSMFRDLDMVCMQKSNAGFIFGTRDGRVMEMQGHVDNLSLDGSTFDAISYSLLTHYSHFGRPATWKTGMFVRPVFLSKYTPNVDVQLRYDFDLAELMLTPPSRPSSEGKWDTALWDDALWSGGARPFIRTRGARGQGRHVAIALRGDAYDEVSLLGFDVELQEGGML